MTIVTVIMAYMVTTSCVSFTGLSTLCMGIHRIRTTTLRNRCFSLFFRFGKLRHIKIRFDIQ